MPTNKKMKGKTKHKAGNKDRPLDELLRAAEQALLTQNPEQAIELYQQAAAASMATSSSDPFQVASILEQSAHAKLSVADQEGARADYRQALTVVANSIDAQNATQLEQTAGLHLYIGQLLQGQDALEEYTKGIALLQTAKTLLEERVSAPSNGLPSDQGDDDAAASWTLRLQESERQLSAAYCNAADLFLTDLCFEDGAEQKCEEYVSMALAMVDAKGEPSVDALQTATSLRLSQSRGLDAIDFVLRVYEKMRVGCEAVSKLVGLSSVLGNQEITDAEARELTEIEEAQSLPEFEFRVQTSKLLLECSNVAKKISGQEDRARMCAEGAVNVLGCLLAENDEVVEIFFLLGEALALLERITPALNFYERAKEMLLSVQQSMEEELAESEEQDDELQQQLDAVTCQLEECSTKIEELEEAIESNEDQSMEE